MNETTNQGENHDSTSEEFGPPVLFVEDLAATKDFYLERLGFTLGFEDATSAGVFLGEEFLILVTIASASDMLPGQSLGSPRGQRSVGLFNIFVEDVDQTFEDRRPKGWSSSSNRRTASGDGAPRTFAIPTG